MFALVDAGAGEVLGLAFERLLRFVRVKGDAVLAGEGGETVLDEEELFAVVKVGEVVTRVVKG